MGKIINDNLRAHIEKDILPEYELNDMGHNINHINLVLDRAYEISGKYNVDDNMLYTVVCFHDLACHVNREEHEKLSAERLYCDEKLKEFFDENQIQIMKEAIEDHRASLEYIPRNIYGKILSSADRKVDIDDYLRSSIGFSMKKEPHLTQEEMIEKSYNYAIKKFGKNGYATTKMYVEDKKYETFLKEIQDLIDNKEKFTRRATKMIEKLKSRG